MSIIVRAKSSIKGLVVDLETLTAAIQAEATTRSQNDGDLATLSTTEKGNLVAAINEVKTQVDAAAGADTALLKADNLSDVADVATARTNLGVMSTTQVEDAIIDAKLALGTNFTVDDIAARDAMVDLDPADRVLVKDAGDGKWALYSPTSVDAAGKPEGWFKLADQASLENSMSAAGIKEAYESNPDTNAFTDAEKAKVGFITVTKAIDLDDVVLVSELAAEVGAGDVAVAASTAAVKAAIDAIVPPESLKPIIERLVVAGNDITLTHVPSGGVAGVMNFGTVRFLDDDGISYDAPLVATADTKVFTISVDTTGQWDTKTVQVQYLYA